MANRGVLVWVFCDQNFSPILPAKKNSKQCLKIIRTENGELMTMVSNFLLKYGSAIGKKDLIFIGSASQLLREGVEGYISSLLDTMDRLSVGDRRECKVLPAPLILLNGCNEPMLIKALLELHDWVRMSGLDGDELLNDPFGAIELFIATNGNGETMEWSPAIHKLPMSLPSKKKSSVFVSGKPNLPKGVLPLNEGDERIIITSLIAKINRKYGNILDCDPNFSRTEAGSICERRKYLIIGGTHAEATAKALETRGAEVQHLHVPARSTRARLRTP
jgi:hypothetical protein